MPTVSKKQEKFMQAVANNPEFAKKVGVNQSTGQEFTKGKNMKKNYMYGGKVKKMKKGGNTSRMNELEELGRVDAEKGYTKKGKRNLAAEKRRVVKEIENKKAGGKVKGYKAGGMADKEGRAMAKNKRGMSAAKMADARGRAMKSGGATMKAKGKGTQGYNARLDESLGMRKGKASTKSQSYKARRDESKGMKKAAGKKAYSGNRSSAQGSASKRADGIAQRGRTRGHMR